MRTIQTIREDSDVLLNSIFVKVNTKTSQRELLEKLKRVMHLQIDLGGEMAIEANDNI